MGRCVVVVGGCGYIGSHLVKLLAQANWDVLVIDNLSTGHHSVEQYAKVFYGDIRNECFLNEVFENHEVEAVFHLAALSVVSDSVLHPASYYSNNVHGSIALFNTLIKHSIGKVIFSSSAAVYGNALYSPIDENHPLKPVNPYGRTKLMVEEILNSYCEAYGISSICLRYFNASGADPDGEFGESHDPETHLIPLAIKKAMNGEEIFINGIDYHTKDGSCVRDFIHVVDLCEAHIKALEKLMLEGRKGQFSAFNIGSGRGFSVREVLEVISDVMTNDDVALDLRVGPARFGDPAVLLADISLATSVLNWTPSRSEIRSIVEDAWSWECGLRDAL